MKYLFLLLYMIPISGYADGPVEFYMKTPTVGTKCMSNLECCLESNLDKCKLECVFEEEDVDFGYCVSKTVEPYSRLDAIRFVEDFKK